MANSVTSAIERVFMAAFILYFCYFVNSAEKKREQLIVIPWNCCENTFSRPISPRDKNPRLQHILMIQKFILI